MVSVVTELQIEELPSKNGMYRWFVPYLTEMLFLGKDQRWTPPMCHFTDVSAPSQAMQACRSGPPEKKAKLAKKLWNLLFTLIYRAEWFQHGGVNQNRIGMCKDD